MSNDMVSVPRWLLEGLVDSASGYHGGATIWRQSEIASVGEDIAKARAALDAPPLPAPAGWVPVAERMPEDMKPVGVWSEGLYGWFCDIARWNPEFDTWQTELWGEGGWVPYGGDITVTHWIELPKAVGE